MPTAIILGLPKSQADRIKGSLKKSDRQWRQHWSVIFVPPTGANAQARQADIRVALTTASQADSSAHVLGITNQGGPRKHEIAAQFVPFFRFRWLPGAWLALPYPSPGEFASKIDETLADEDDWRQRVQPTEIGAALLLPEPSFASKLSDLWGLAAKYGDGCNLGCARRMAEFHRAHHKPHTSKRHAKDYFWTDDDLRIFDHTQEQHGEAPNLRPWKFSFRMPKGFHPKTGS